MGYKRKSEQKIRGKKGVERICGRRLTKGTEGEKIREQDWGDGGASSDG